MKRKDIIAEAFNAAYEFYSRKLWKRFTNYDCFGVRIAGQNDLMLGVVLGDAGEEYGLSLFRGPRAVASFAGLLDSEGLGDDVVEDVDLLSFNMDMFGNLPPDAQSLLREAGVHPRYDEQVPHFFVKPPGRQPRLPDESELSLLHLVLRAVIEADQKKLVHPATLEDEEGIELLSNVVDEKNSASASRSCFDFSSTQPPKPDSGRDKRVTCHGLRPGLAHTLASVGGCLKSPSASPKAIPLSSIIALWNHA